MRLLSFNGLRRRRKKGEIGLIYLQLAMDPALKDIFEDVVYWGWRALRRKA